MAAGSRMPNCPSPPAVTWPSMRRLSRAMDRTIALRPAVPPLRATMAALSANLVGIGLARFGYTPLIPALIGAGWFMPSAAVYLGAANLAGYLAGALGARILTAQFSAPVVLRTAMLLTAGSLVACAFP